jgi:hypothetical protein
MRTIMTFRRKVTRVGDHQIIERPVLVDDDGSLRIITHIELSTVDQPLEVVPDDRWMKRDARHG